MPRIYYTGNYWLTLDEMKVNASYIHTALDGEWTINAICGLLGNTQTESHHNPGIWQNLAVNKGPGYGLTQWTPYRKYTTWCAQNGYEKDTMEAALARLRYEVENPSLQWVKHSGVNNISFYDWTQSDLSPNTLAMIFLRNYEMPGDLNQPQRGTQAEYWYEYLMGTEPPDPDPPEPPAPGPGGTGVKTKTLNPALYQRVIKNRRR